MEHSFDTEIAKEYGIQEAILLKFIYFWVEKNRVNEKHFYDDKYWTYNSLKAMVELFPYLTERQINYALNNLIDKGLIIKGNYNEKSYDRTLWYSITASGYAILQNCQMHFTKLSNGIDKIVTPIPFNLPVKEPDNNIYGLVVDYLNEKAGTFYKKNTKSTQASIRARINEGFTFEDFKKVIDTKCKSWKKTEWEKFLRPETLFGTKFESYLNEKENTNKSNTFSQMEYNKDELNSFFDNLDEIDL